MDGVGFRGGSFCFDLDGFVARIARLAAVQTHSFVVWVAAEAFHLLAVAKLVFARARIRA